MNFNLKTIYNNDDDCKRAFEKTKNNIKTNINWNSNCVGIDNISNTIHETEKILISLENIFKYILLKILNGDDIQENLFDIKDEVYTISKNAIVTLVNNIKDSNKNDLESIIKELYKKYPLFTIRNFITSNFTQLQSPIEIERCLTKSYQENESHEYLKYYILAHYIDYKKFAKNLGFNSSLDLALKRLEINKDIINKIYDVKKIRKYNKTLKTLLTTIYNKYNNKEITVNMKDQILEIISNTDEVKIDNQVILKEILTTVEKYIGIKERNIIQNAINIGKIKLDKCQTMTDGITITTLEHGAYVYSRELTTEESIHMLIHELGHLVKEDTAKKMEFLETTEYSLLEEIPSIVNQILLVETNSIKEIQTKLALNLLNYFDQNLISIYPLIKTEMKIMKNPKFDIDNIYFEYLNYIYKDIYTIDKHLEKSWVLYDNFTSKLTSLTYVIGIIVGINVAYKLILEEDYKENYRQFLELKTQNNPIEKIRDILKIDLNDDKTIELAYNYMAELIESFMVK